jgi:SMI1 / KNR4 family (SUKH-1)
MRYSPATEADLMQFEASHGPIPEAFRWFLLACGGGVIGAEWIDGIEQLSKTHLKYKTEIALLRGWTMQDVFPIGWDGAGNPIVLNIRTGAVQLEDHNFGGTHEVAPNFEEFMCKGLGASGA